MATSISESVNYKQAAAAPDYQVAARPVDTFVSGTGNETLTRSGQVAAALEQASGALVNVKKTQDREAEKAEREATALQKDQATVLASELAADHNNELENITFTEESTEKDAFASIFQVQEDDGNGNLVNSALSQKYLDARKKFENNPAALAQFENVFAKATYNEWLTAKGKAVDSQIVDATAKRISNIYTGALTDEQNEDTRVGDYTGLEGNQVTDKNKRISYEIAQGIIYSDLIEVYGKTPSEAAKILAGILETQTKERTADGRANTYMAEQYLLDGFGGNEERGKILDSIAREKKSAAATRSQARIDADLKDTETTSTLANFMMAESLGEPVPEGITLPKSIEEIQQMPISQPNKDKLATLFTQLQKIENQKRQGKLKFTSPNRRDNIIEMLKVAAFTKDYGNLLTGAPVGSVPSADDLKNAILSQYQKELLSEDWKKVSGIIDETLAVASAVNRKISTATYKAREEAFNGRFGTSSYERKTNKFTQAVYGSVNLSTGIQERAQVITNEKIAALPKGTTVTGQLINELYYQSVDDLFTELETYLSTRDDTATPQNEREDILNTAAGNPQERLFDLSGLNKEQERVWEQMIEDGRSGNYTFDKLDPTTGISKENLKKWLSGGLQIPARIL
tara:strand:+ start:6364 stop:8259 length:1896 start_codon:yes stop_codon:yes gene_type:complete